MSKQKFWNWNDRSELVLDGVIASESWYGDEVTPQLFRDELAEHNGDLTIVINSPGGDVFAGVAIYNARSEEHTTELQSREKNVCRLLPEKKKETCSTSRATRASALA